MVVKIESYLYSGHDGTRTYIVSVYTGDFHDSSTEGNVKIELIGRYRGQEVTTGMQELTESKNHAPQKFQRSFRDEFHFVDAKNIGELSKIR